MSSSIDNLQTLTEVIQPNSHAKQFTNANSTTDLTKINSLNENSSCIPTTTTTTTTTITMASSNVCLTEIENTTNNNKSIDNLMNSNQIGASLTSLTPSHAGTYILDMDDTLMAQGIPPVIIRSHETLASVTTAASSNPHKQSTILMTTTTTTHGDDSVHVEIATPRGSPSLHKKLWHDNEEEQEGSDNDLVLVDSSDHNGQPPYTMSIYDDVEDVEDDDEFTEQQYTMESLRADYEDTYKSLPSPNPFLSRIPSGSSLNMIDSSFSVSIS
ncbi:unnamed protein product [Schistosoma turkestanicum]|nr:unnamed protein product [Schistosoma turkestanicum]